MIIKKASQEKHATAYKILTFSVYNNCDLMKNFEFKVFCICLLGGLKFLLYSMC